ASFIFGGVTSLFCLSISFLFQERPPLPPTLAQATARCIPVEEYSYVASILRLLRNRPFVLLILTYGWWAVLTSALPPLQAASWNGVLKRSSMAKIK
uniref:Uncharacterized protein n=1 Tax=Oryzias sinensis TaxID=183150 RepID=A0A8C7ZQV9_9TELE